MAGIMSLIDTAIQQASDTTDACAGHVRALEKLDAALAGAVTDTETGVEDAEKAVKAIQDAVDALETAVEGQLADVDSALLELEAQGNAAQNAVNGEWAETEGLMKDLKTAADESVKQIDKSIEDLQQQLEETTKAGEKAASDLETSVAASEGLVKGLQDDFDAFLQGVKTDMAPLREAYELRRKHLTDGLKQTATDQEDGLKAIRSSLGRVEKGLSDRVEGTTSLFALVPAVKDSLVGPALPRFRELGKANEELISTARKHVEKARSVADKDAASLLKKLKECNTAMVTIKKIFDKAKSSDLL